MRSLTLVAVLLLAACGRRDSTPDGAPVEVRATNGSAYDENAKPVARFRVTRVGLFADDIAYRGARGLYLIVDTETGREFFGVSGVGISDLGSHSQPAGKVIRTVGDER